MIKVSFVIWRPFQKLNTEFSDLGGGFLDVVLTKKSNQVECDFYKVVHSEEGTKAVGTQKILGMLR